MEIKDSVASYIARHSLLDKNKKHLVALSGGADSVVLFLLLLDLGYDIEAVHCNFHLRGKESDRDEKFVSAFCYAKNIPLHLVHFDTREYASLHKVSIEMAARQLRYRYFEQLRHDIDAADICVAHHRDDSVETVLMNLIRGTGLRGLAGIRPKNGHIIRPLLCISRQDIEQYLDRLGQDYVTDSSNLVDDVVRNKLRLNVIPQLKSINPAISENIRQTTEYVSDAIRILDEASSKAISRISTQSEEDGIIIDICQLLAESSPSYILFEILKGYGFTSTQVEQIYAGAMSLPGRIFSAAEYDLLIDRGKIIIERKKECIKPIKIIEEGTFIIAGEHKLKLTTRPIDNDFILSRTSNTVCLDADKVRFPLTLRPTERGDRFVPFGMKGSKLVSDYLTDCKKTLFQKRRQLVLTDASNSIIWLINERPDNHFRINGNSKRALIVSFI